MVFKELSPRALSQQLLALVRKKEKKTERIFFIEKKDCYELMKCSFFCSEMCGLIKNTVLHFLIHLLSTKNTVHVLVGEGKVGGQKNKRVTASSHE